MDFDEKNVKGVITDKVHIGKKCAIYNRLSVSNDEQLKLNRKELIAYCNSVLKIDNYVLFEEVASLNDDRVQFNEMMSRIDKNEFTDILVYNTNRIYRANYDREIYKNIFEKIRFSSATLHSITEEIISDVKY